MWPRHRAVVAALGLFLALARPARPASPSFAVPQKSLKDVSRGAVKGGPTLRTPRRAFRWKKTPVAEAMMLQAAGAVRRAGAGATAVEPEETIFKQGDPGDKFYIIADGQVKAYVQKDEDRIAEEEEEEMVKHYRTGEYFGELALLTRAPRRDAQTLLLYLSRDHFERTVGSMRRELILREAAFRPARRAQEQERRLAEASVTEQILGLSGSLRRFLLTVLLYLMVGTAFYFYTGFEELPSTSPVVAFYFSVETALAVGFGVLTPRGPNSAFFTALYVISGAAILVNFLSGLVADLLEDVEDRRRRGEGEAGGAALARGVPTAAPLVLWWVLGITFGRVHEGLDSTDEASLLFCSIYLLVVGVPLYASVIARVSLLIADGIVKRRQREIRKRAILAMEGCDDECRLDVFSMYDHDQEGSATTGWMSVFTTEQSRTKAHPTEMPELLRFLSAARGLEITDHDIQFLINEWDEDKTETITQAEFLAGLKQWQSMISEGKSACGTRSSGPVLEIDLGNFTVVLDPTDYARLEFLDEDGDDEGETSRNSAEDSAQDAASEPESSGAGAQGAVHPAGEQTCVPMVMHIDLPPPLHERTLILGEPVLQRYYTVFDADGERPRVGFAPARHQLEAVAEAPEAAKLKTKPKGLRRMRIVLKIFMCMMVPADLEAEAKRLLQWANSDAAWRGPPPASSAAPNPSVAVRGASAAAGSSYLGGCEDPFAELLAQSDGVASGFCEVPVMLLRRIRAEGQAQLAEIAELRAQLAKLPEVEEEVAEMEAELQELQTNCVVNANEIELRKMEAETLASEAVRLKDEKQQRMKRLEALTAQATKIVVFLKAAVVQDVHISIKYAGICHSDIHQEWGKGIFPMVPGHEIAGVVESVGEGVTKFKVGDKVGVGVFVDSCRQCSACKSGDENYCEPGMEYDEEGGAPTYGGYSQSITVDEAYVLKIPDGMDMAGAAPLLCAGITVYAPMVFHNLKPGMKLAVAGLGGLGAMAVLIGKAMGAEVTVLTRSAAKKTGTLGRPGGRSGHRLREEALKGLKADKVVVVTDEDEAKSVKGHVAVGEGERRGYFNMMINTISAQYDLSAYLDMLANAGKLLGPSSPLFIPDEGRLLPSKRK
ncbi:Probable formaldehyde dehydrogenase AdhA [Durusdinium trenchii]|uniref:Probable formaldehyde dehydrogenase AdhA n=1 Tax=Durusdinium trenchii TaxID=1381693 RepID=A0ABP0ILZ6_9DINO